MSVALFVVASPASGQGLSPMQKQGKTMSDKKLFRLTLINPYAREMRYELSAEDRYTNESQSDVKFTGRHGYIAPKNQKKVLVLVPVESMRREVRVCLRFPEMQETIRPRVCADFTAIAVNSHEHKRSVHAPSATGNGG